ncbi:MAG: hypothetical protein ACK4PR_03445 [Gammaproteobacteria bacterium]
METLNEWHNQVVMDFSEIGICFREDSIALNPYKISSSLAEEITNDMIILSKIIRKAVDYYYNLALATARIDYHEIIALYKNKKRLPPIMRPDGIFVDGQLKIIEINIDSGIGGIWEMDFLQEKYKQHPSFSSYTTKEIKSPKEAFLNFLENFRLENFAKNYCEPVLGLIGYTDYNQFYIDQAQDICEWITKNTGFRAIYQTPEMLKKEGDYITDGNIKYDVLFRDGSLVHLPRKTSSMLNLIKETASTKTLFLSDPYDLLIEHKAILAFLYKFSTSDELVSIFSKNEINFIKKYIPPTYMLSEEEIIYKNKRYFLDNLLIDNKNDFVIKKCCSHAGEDVYLGCDVDQIEWENIISIARKDGVNSWVVQEMLESDTYKFIYKTKGKGFFEEEQRYTFSPFLFDKFFGGGLIRIEQDNKRRILSLPTNNNIGSCGLFIEGNYCD